jgi:drug/metabolite transporter (DMT)-like permease
MTSALVLLFGLAVAVAWGSADTLAASVTRRIGTAATTLTAQVSGLLLAAIVTLAFGLPLLSPHTLALSLIWGIIVGAAGAGGYLMLYKALHHGPLSVASPLVSAQGAVTLVLAVVLLHELPGTWQAMFLGVIFGGIMLAAANLREVGKLAPGALLSPGVACALISMLCFGFFVFGLGEASRATYWLLVVVWSRIFSCLILTVFLRPQGSEVGKETNEAAGLAEAAGTAKRYGLHWLCGAAIVGMLDIGGVLLLGFVTATGGPIGIVGMVSSAYGLIPLVCGILLFRERPAANQIAGVALLIAGLVGIAAPQSVVSLLLLALAGGGTLALLLFWCGKTLHRRRVTRLVVVPLQGKE